MDPDPEMLLKDLCCTCLSVDRKLYRLCRVKDGVNCLYWLLTYDSEAYKLGFFKGSSSLHVCWECAAVIGYITRFRSQACVAQIQLNAILDGQVQIKNQDLCLSRLRHAHNKGYNHKIKFRETIDSTPIDNFIDCGRVEEIKLENEADDIPLSQLKSKIKGDDILATELKNKNQEDDILLSETENIYLDNEDANSITESHKESNLKKTKKKTLKKDTGSLEEKRVKKPRKATWAGSKPRGKQPATDLTLGYACGECDQRFGNKNQRWKHVQSKHREGFKCSTCEKRFAFKNNLARHELLHGSPPARAACPVCGARVRADLARAHARTHGPRAPRRCAPCGLTFVSTASYENHLKYARAHAGEQQPLRYKCGSCDKRYRSGGELRDHFNYQHMGKTQHKCPVCDKALATRRCVTRHVKRAHHGIKENARDKICGHCGNTFRDKKSLREHEFIHTGERPLSCELCGCTFRQTASLYTHRKRVHKIYPKKKTVELLVEEEVQVKTSVQMPIESLQLST